MLNVIFTMYQSWIFSAQNIFPASVQSNFCIIIDKPKDPFTVQTVDCWCTDYVANCCCDSSFSFTILLSMRNFAGQMIYRKTAGKVCTLCRHWLNSSNVFRPEDGEWCFFKFKACYLTTFSITEIIKSRWQTNEYRALLELCWQRRTDVLGEHPVTVPLGTPQIQHRSRTLTS
jgi:hypothetical protein